MSKLFKNITIVIPTIPRNYPDWWISQIYSFIDCGIKLFIVIPPSYSCDLFPESIRNHINVSLLISPNKGQVIQRVFGFSKVFTPYTLQLDDDVKISVNDIGVLLNTLIDSGSSSAIGPRFASYPFRQPCQSTPNLGTFANLFTIFIAHTVHGIPWGSSIYGRITPSGFGYHYPLNFFSDHPLLADWLPGGCLFHHTCNLLLDFQYPFEGKAYAEDLIHSHLLRDKNISLYYEPSVTVLTVPPDRYEFSSLNPFCTFPDFYARKYYISLFNGSYLRFRIFYLIKKLIHILILPIMYIIK